MSADEVARENLRENYSGNETAEGYLTVQVASARRALPVYGALVTVYATEAESPVDLLAILQTDAGGETDTVRLPAPPSSNSQQPDGGAAYSIYYARVMAVNYTARDKVPIQVFPGVKSVLVVNMLPPPDDM